MRDDVTTDPRHSRCCLVPLLTITHTPKIEMHEAEQCLARGTCFYLAKTLELHKCGAYTHSKAQYLSRDLNLYLVTTARHEPAPPKTAAPPDRDPRCPGLWLYGSLLSSCREGAERAEWGNGRAVRHTQEIND